MITDTDKYTLQSEKPQIRAYSKRWAILAIYVTYATLSSFQWVEYSIITNLVMKYYHVSASAVDWTSMSFGLMWPILVFPASFIINKMGLRVTALIGALTTFIGAGIKIFSIGEDRFYVVMIGQTVAAASQIFILSLPPKVAVTWFKPQEISTVCSIGIFGMTLGGATGFLIPPIIVQDSDNLEVIGYNFKIMCWGLTLVIAPVVLAVIFYFPAEPPHPPSQAMLDERENREVVTFWSFINSVKTLMKSKAFLLQTFCYSCDLGIYTAVGTLLNQLVLSYFPGAQEEAGRMGLVMIVTGMIGSVITGFVLDRTHRYKETAFILLLLSSVGMGLLAVAMEMKIKWLIYVTIGFFGFFLSAYMPAGVEFGTEITFPTPESTVTGLLMTSSQIVSVILTIMLSNIIDRFGTLACILTMAGVLGSGAIVTVFTPNTLNRQAAFAKEKNVNFVLIKQ